MDLEFLLNQVKRAIYDDPATPHREGHDPSGLMGQLEGIFGNFGRQQQPRRSRQVLPASQDPYGDPADAERGSYAYMDQEGLPPGVRPASEDPLGDPGDQFPNVRPASEDPLGDPGTRSHVGAAGREVNSLKGSAVSQAYDGPGTRGRDARATLYFPL